MNGRRFAATLNTLNGRRFAAALNTLNGRRFAAALNTSRSMLERWVRFWDRREPADVLAIVRIGVGLTLLFDLLTALALGLVPRLWSPIEERGFGPVSYENPISVVYSWFGASSTAAWVLFIVSCVSAAGLCVGLFTRSHACVFVLAYAQLSHLSPAADRGIDVLLRNACLVLACSDAGATFALDAWLFRRDEHGRRRWRHDVLVPAWPRYLLILQLVVMYFSAGLLKQSGPWTSLDGYSALYIVLRRPHVARFAVPTAWLTACYPLLQIATFLTVVFERAALLVPLLLWMRETRQRGGRLRELVARSRVLELWVGLGVSFHLGLALLLQLGIFPWGCLALYPALAHPNTLRQFFAHARDRVGNWRKPPAVGDAVASSTD